MITHSRVVPEIATRSWLFEQAKAVLVAVDSEVDTKSELPVRHRMAAALFATALSQSAFYPVSLLKTQLQAVVVSKKRVRESRLFHLVALDLRKDGIASLWRGLCPSLIRTVSEMFIFEALKITHVAVIGEDLSFFI